MKILEHIFWKTEDLCIQLRLNCWVISIGISIAHTASFPKTLSYFMFLQLYGIVAVVQHLLESFAICPVVLYVIDILIRIM